MTAHDYYMVVVGEIGISPETFKHELLWWEIRCILRGYSRRRRDLWSATRWQTFRLMEVQIGSDELKKAGVNKPSDLLPLPWDEANHLTKDDIAEMQAEMAALNAMNEKKSE